MKTRPLGYATIVAITLAIPVAVSGCGAGATSDDAGTGTQGRGGSNGSGGSTVGGSDGTSTGGSGGGNSGTGGAAASTGGTTGETGGTTGAGGAGGTSAAGGAIGAGGTPATGGTRGAGGASAGGGTTGTGGTAGTSGHGGAGGGTATGGSGGAAGSGGVTGAGGMGGKPDQNALPAITIHMAGDSTMSDYPSTTTQEGWGQELGQYFIGKVTIDNQAQPGANIQTFYGGRWKTLISNVKPGDYVMAAFGINDSGTTHGPVTPSAFQTQMGVMADEVAAKKATFIPTTSSPLQIWVGGVDTNTRLQPYCDATIALGKNKGLLVDDLNTLGIAYYNMIGQTAAAALTFNGDKAHFDKQGATEMALLASEGLAKVNSPLAAYLK